jgi:hypothetical protein
MKITVTVAAFATIMGCVSAFAPNAHSNAATSLRMADAAPEEPTPEVQKQWPKVNGWVADPSKFCAGLPGSTSPLGEFDPLGFTKKMSIEEIKRYRESEVTHGRVAMLATVGYLVGESKFHPFFGGVVSGPANTHLAQVQEVAPAFFVALTVGIAITELVRAVKGWKIAGVSLCVMKVFNVCSHNEKIFTDTLFLLVFLIFSPWERSYQPRPRDLARSSWMGITPATLDLILLA